MFDPFSSRVKTLSPANVLGTSTSHSNSSFAFARFFATASENPGMRIASRTRAPIDMIFTFLHASFGVAPSQEHVPSS